MGKKIIYLKLLSCGRSRAGLVEKIAQIDAIIDFLLTTAATSVQNGNLVQYELDTGQSKQKVEYTTPGQVAAALKTYENMRTYYVLKTQPRTMKATNYKQFR